MILIILLFTTTLIAHPRCHQLSAAFVANHPILSEEKEIELGKRILGGDINARNELVEANLKLAITVASKFTNNPGALEDNIQTANLALIKAADTYDPAKGRFAGYAATIMRSYLIAEARSNRLIRIKYNWRIANMVKRFRNAKNKFPNASEEELFKLANIPDRAGYWDKVRNIISILDAELSSQPVETLPMREIWTEDTPENIERFLGKVLDHREIVIVKGRMGFDGEEKTLQELATELDLTRERVRQLEIQGLRKLREAWFNERLRN